MITIETSVWTRPSFNLYFEVSVTTLGYVFYLIKSTKNEIYLMSKRPQDFNGDIIIDSTKKHICSPILWCCWSRLGIMNMEYPFMLSKHFSSIIEVMVTLTKKESKILVLLYFTPIVQAIFLLGNQVIKIYSQLYNENIWIY